MFFVVGTGSKTSTVEEGLFYCPTCEHERQYEHKIVNQTGTFFFVPIANVGELGRYIECQFCGETFREEVLDHQAVSNPEKFEAEFRKAMKYVMVAVSISDGQMSQIELEKMSSVFFEFTGSQVSREELVDLANHVNSERVEVAEYLKTVSPYLNDVGKGLIIKTLLHVAFADDEFNENEQRVIAYASAALDISDAHMKGIFQEYNESLGAKELQ